MPVLSATTDTAAPTTTPSSTTMYEYSTTTAETPTTTLISSPSITAPSTTANAAPTATAQSSTTAAVNPTTMPVFSAPPATENVAPTTTPLSLKTEASTTTDVNPQTTFISSATAPTTTINAATAQSWTTEGYTTTAVSSTTTHISSESTTTAKAAPTTPLSTTNEALSTTAVNPTTTSVFSVPTVTENAAPTETPSSTIENETYTTIAVTSTTTLISSPTTTAPSTATNAAPTATAQSSTTEASATAAVNPTTMPVFSAPPATENVAPTTPLSLTTEASTSTAVNPTTTLISSATAPTTTTNAAPTPFSTTEGYTTTAVSPTATLISSLTTTALSTATNAAPTATTQSSTTEASTTQSVNPTTTLISSATAPSTTSNAAPSSSSTTEDNTTTAVSPTTTQISSETTTTAKAAPTTQLSKTNETLTTKRVNPTTMPVFPAPTTAPPATENATPGTTAQSSTNEVSTTTTVNSTTMPVFPEPPTNAALPTIAVTSTTDASTITAVNPTSMPFSSGNTSAPLTTTSSAPTPTSITKGYTTTAVTPTTLSVFSGPTIAPPATENAVRTTTLPSISSSSSLLSPSTTSISPTTIPLFTTTRTAAATTFVTPTTMPMFSEFTKSFLTTTSLLNAATNAVTPTRLSETQNPAPTAFVSQSTKTVSLATTETTAPTIIIVTQETTMPLSMSAAGAPPTTSVSPLSMSGATTSMPITSAATIASTQTTAVVASKLLFNSSSPVPSESLVLSAINTLLKSRESQINESVKVVNVIYKRISETSYVVVFTFNLVNISMPEDPDLRGDTYQQVQDTINNALNTLLNEPGSPTLQPKTSNFTSTSKQIDGRMEYSFQDGDVIQPVSFLNELRLPTTTTVFPETTTSVSITAPTLISGSGVVTSKLVFNSSSPIPSESLVLSAIKTLRNSRESQLNESVKVVNVTYEKISETSYAVVFTFNVINISMPEDPASRGNTNQQVQDIINNALNTLLNEPGSPNLQPKTSNFTSTSNQIDGRMEYSFQDGDVIQPVSFLNELRLPTTTTVFPETTFGFSVTPSNLISGSGVVTSKLVFNSSSPIPSESLVLSAIKTLRNSRESQLNESVKVVNVTYEKISESSYAVIFKFNMSDISMPRDSGLRNNIYLQVENTINKALNTLLNEPSSPNLQPKPSIFKSTLNQIEGSMVYNFQDIDVIKPVNFLQTLNSLTVLTTASTLTTSITSPLTLLGTIYINIRLVFNTLGQIPSETIILQLVKSLIGPRYRTKEVSTPTQDASLVNVTYTKINDTSYALTFGFEISNISMSEKIELRNETYTLIKSTINGLLIEILKDPSASQFDLQHIELNDNSTVILASVQYVFSESDLNTNSTFVKELFKANEVLTTASTLTTTPPIVLGRALIFIRLVFVTLGPLPNPEKVLEVANTLLNTRLTTKQDTKTQALSDPVSFVNVTYTKINETAYALDFGFEISNITMSEKLELRDGTHLTIQDSINTLLGKMLLSNSSAPLIKFQPADFTGNSTVIKANVEYVFSPSDITKPSIFVQELLQLDGASILTTTTSPPILTRRGIIKIRLEFITLGPRPSESNVLQVVKSMLASNLTTKLTTRVTSMSEPLSLENVEYLGINDTAYALIFAFEINKVSLTEINRKEAYQEIQKKINDLVIQILKDPSVNLLIPADFKDDLFVIQANVTYVFSQRDSNTASGFLVSALFTAFTTPVPTTMNATTSNNGTNVAWIVAIIVPCAIVIGLVPCWILLCCLLCGCCAAIRRRWHRRQSYNVQYTTRNSLF
ncbi:serine-rich adhesin for platelets-like isoform X2 [Sinocyclocheilus anshuiensis]|uniref:serine-rich adhesin for platelets-like isoform X2 n=1 Tax=Sinocyclocheilus anshuiensis TaxID=1608454 RepID=UPI0007BA78A0|nr:PREDICTED: serine-rich adhesin for platelets-like isoform X2 [Sinocyclocheilus anshuiensis]